jgi:hypothetical protein
MVRPGREKLSGKIEEDEAYFGGPESGGKRGRGTENTVLAAIAIETNEGKVGRMRIAISSRSQFGHCPWIYRGYG